MSGPLLCPICKKEATPRERPFCSKRCREIDLSRWLGGHYAIPAQDQTQTGGNDNDNDNERS